LIHLGLTWLSYHHHHHTVRRLQNGLGCLWVIFKYQKVFSFTAPIFLLPSSITPWILIKWVKTKQICEKFHPVANSPSPHDAYFDSQVPDQGKKAVVDLMKRIKADLGHLPTNIFAEEEVRNMQSLNLGA